MAAVAAAAAPSFSSVAAPRRAPCALFARSCLCPSAAAVARSLPRCSISSQLTRSGPFTPWSGLKCLAVTLRRDLSSKERKEKCRGKVVYASLFGVGAPEVLVIGVVALLVFGPKGLAEVARTLGKTLRAFQPTIKELQDVSKEFKSTLEREIGLDEISSSTNYINKSALYADQNQQAAIDPNGKPSGQSYTSEELLKVTEDQLAASVASSEVKEPKPETASDAAEPASGKQLQASTLEASTKSETGESAPKDEAQVPSSDTTENQR